MQICFGFCSYVAFHLAPKAANSHLSLIHYFICVVLLPRCFGVASLLRRCFGVAPALLRRRLRVFGVASAFVRRSLGFGVGSAACAATSVHFRCNFGSTLAQQCDGFDQNLTAGCSDPLLCGLWVACSLHDWELLKALKTFRFFNHERHNITCFEVYWT